MKKDNRISKLIISDMTKHLGKIILSLALIIILIPFDTFAQGGLLITPRRVVFDGKKNTINVNLANSGQDTSTYLISFVQYRMRVDGGFDQITEPDSGQFFADKYIRLYPRKVTLPPGTNQVVKLQLRGYKKLKDGEYRSHLIFKLKNDLTALGMEDEDRDTTTISIRLVPVFGISIPAIIRKGKSTTQVSLSDLAVNMVNDTTPSLNITFNRTGNFSVYGDVTVDYISPDLEEPVQVGVVRGLAVYTPNKLRHFTLTLDNNYNYNKGKLRVVYKSKSDLNKTVTLAEKELTLEN
jgi:P pilus assembly chaperone PapD